MYTKIDHEHFHNVKNKISTLGRHLSVKQFFPVIKKNILVNTYFQK